MIDPLADNVVACLAVRQQAMEIYNDEQKVHDFLHLKHPLLNGRRPVDVAVDPPGADLVIQLLGRAAYGGCI